MPTQSPLNNIVSKCGYTTKFASPKYEKKQLKTEKASNFSSPLPCLVLKVTFKTHLLWIFGKMSVKLSFRLFKLLFKG